MYHSKLVPFHDFDSLLNQIFTITGDITKMEDCKKVADETAKYFGRIDILVRKIILPKMRYLSHIVCSTNRMSLLLTGEQCGHGGNWRV